MSKELFEPTLFKKSERDFTAGLFATVKEFVYFGSPQFKIVGGGNKKLLIFKIVNDELVKTEPSKEHGNDLDIDRVNSMIKWNETSEILIGDSSKRVYYYCIEKMKCLSKIENLEGEVCKLLKLNDNSFLSSAFPYTLNLISISKNETKQIMRIIKRLDPQKCYTDSTKLALSKIFSNCFYINTVCADKNEVREVIRCIDYQENKLKKEAFKTEDYIYSFCVFLESPSSYSSSFYNEILCFTDRTGKCFFFNMGNSVDHESPKFMKQLTITIGMNVGICLSLGKFGNTIIFGAVGGSIIFLQRKTEKIKRIQGIHKHLVYTIKYKYGYTSPNTENKKLLLFSCGGTHLKYFRVDGLSYSEDDVKSKFEKNDFEERVNFLREEIELFLFNEEEKEKSLFKIILVNSQINMIFKFTMLR